MCPMSTIARKSTCLCSILRGTLAHCKMLPFQLMAGRWRTCDCSTKFRVFERIWSTPAWLLEWLPLPLSCNVSHLLPQWRSFGQRGTSCPAQQRLVVGLKKVAGLNSPAILALGCLHSLLSKSGQKSPPPRLMCCTVPTSSILAMLMP